jgi:predicted nucleic acid-binding Zn finger protein
MSLEQLDILRKACADVRKADDGGPGWSEAWAVLHFLCPEVAPGAAEILDSKMITRVVARHSRREFFLVEGSQKRDYTCMPGFCTCDYYCQRVATRPDALVCKHELAVLLAGSLGVAHQCELDDGEWATKFELAISVECVVLTRHSPRVLSAPPAPPRSQFAYPCSHTPTAVMRLSRPSSQLPAQLRQARRLGRRRRMAAYLLIRCTVCSREAVLKAVAILLAWTSAQAGT